MSWHAQLMLRFGFARQETQLHVEHTGPLRVLKSLYPEGPAVCHAIVVHPPGGLVGGDSLDIRVHVEPQAHALVSTPGATRFYKTSGPRATQRVDITVAERARMEWLPLETIAYPGCWAGAELSFKLAPTAQIMVWDALTLGLPLANQAFDAPNLARVSEFEQTLTWPAHWLERGLVRGDDHRLLRSNLGWAGQRCLGTLVLAQGQAFARDLREHLQDSLRASWAGAVDARWCGVTQPADGVLVVRTLGPVAEPVMNRLKTSWAVLRQAAWNMPNEPPRIWSV